MAEKEEKKNINWMKCLMRDEVMTALQAAMLHRCVDKPLFIKVGEG